MSGVMDIKYHPGELHCAAHFFTYKPGLSPLSSGICMKKAFA